MVPDEPEDQSPSKPAEAGERRPTAGEETAPEPANGPLFAMGDDTQVPLAAVFKRRKTGSTASGRRTTRPVPEAGEPAVGPAEGGSYDVVLTDAFRVSEEANAPPVAEGPPPVVSPPAPANSTPPPPPAPAAPTTTPPPVPVAAATPPPPPGPPPPPPPPVAAVPPSPPVAPASPLEPRLETPSPEPDESIEIPDDTEPAARVGLPENAVDLDPALAVDTILSLARKSAAVRRTPTAGAWFADLFGNDYFLAHPQRLGPSTQNEVAFIEAALRAPAGGRILDLCCGYGRHTVPLAGKGYELVGLDLSLDMLKAALGRAQANSLAIKFVHGDMRDLNFREVFDGVFSFDSSFGFFTEPENLMVLRGVHDALKKGGRFVLDVANRDYAIRGIPTRNWWEGDGCLVQEDIEFDYLTSRLAIKRFAVFADGMQREYNISMRLYGLHELVRMFQMVGFEIREVSGHRHTAGAFFGPESARIILVGEKSGPRA